VVGICLGGGYAVRAAAQDPRIRAVAGIAGGYNSPTEMAASMGIGEYRSALSGFLDRYDSYLPRRERARSSRSFGFDTWRVCVPGHGALGREEPRSA
jgi:dienelactone hydrolase